MNLRILKKHCKRARDVLIQYHGVKPDCFTSADGGESINTPHGMEKRFNRNGWLDPGLLPGTPVYWSEPTYYEGESDCQLPTDLLSEIIMWQHWKPSAADIAEWDAHADRENAALATRSQTVLSTDSKTDGAA
jgi:hypothetical protein